MQGTRSLSGEHLIAIVNTKWSRQDESAGETAIGHTATLRPVHALIHEGVRVGSHPPAQVGVWRKCSLRKLSWDYNKMLTLVGSRDDVRVFLSMLSSSSLYVVDVVGRRRYCVLMSSLSYVVVVVNVWKRLGMEVACIPLSETPQ